MSPDLITSKENEPGLKQQVVVATSTFYKDFDPAVPIDKAETEGQLRAHLALQFVQKALNEGYQVVVVDGGSDIRFINALKQTKAKIFVEPGIKMSPGRQKAFLEATKLDFVNQRSEQQKIKVIVWSEPEKVNLIKDLWSASQPVITGEVDIVVPKRDKEAFDTLPPYQAEFEQRSNGLFNKMLRIWDLRKDEDPDLDMWFGPRIFANNPELLKIFLRQYRFNPASTPLQNFSSLDKTIDVDLWQNATFFPVCNALENGYRVISMPVDYRHPTAQTRFEMQKDKSYREKRRKQLQEIIVSTRELLLLLQLEKSAQGKVSSLQSRIQPVIEED